MKSTNNQSRSNKFIKIIARLAKHLPLVGFRDYLKCNFLVEPLALFELFENAGVQPPQIIPLSLH
jgi:hypothetical protein